MLKTQTLIFFIIKSQKITFFYIIKHGGQTIIRRLFAIVAATGCSQLCLVLLQLVGRHKTRGCWRTMLLLLLFPRRWIASSHAFFVSTRRWGQRKKQVLLRLCSHFIVHLIRLQLFLYCCRPSSVVVSWLNFLNEFIVCRKRAVHAKLRMPGVQNSRRRGQRGWRVFCLWLNVSCLCRERPRGIRYRNNRAGRCKTAFLRVVGKCRRIIEPA